MAPLCHLAHKWSTCTWRTSLSREYLCLTNFVFSRHRTSSTGTWIWCWKIQIFKATLWRRGSCLSSSITSRARPLRTRPLHTTLVIYWKWSRRTPWTLRRLRTCRSSALTSSGILVWTMDCFMWRKIPTWMWLPRSLRKITASAGV